MASYRDKYDAAKKANKDFQLASGVDHTFTESEEFKASYIEGLNMAERAQIECRMCGKMFEPTSELDVRCNGCVDLMLESERIHAENLARVSSEGYRRIERGIARKARAIRTKVNS